MTTRIYLEGTWEMSRGVIGRYPNPDEEFVFQFDDQQPRLIHMLGVRRPLRVRWYIGAYLIADEILGPWTGWGIHVADRVVETRPET